MNSPSTPVSGTSFNSRGFGPTLATAARPFFWSIRRELWENRLIYLAPLAAAVLFLFAFAISIIRLRLADTLRQWTTQRMATQYEIASALVMGIGLLVGIIYCIDALYGERRDRSILFWKSLPVSDLTAVLSKFAVPIVIVPLLSFVITVGAQFMMLVLSSALLAGSGVNIGSLWGGADFFRISLIWLYHLLVVHGLWYAPLYAWLLLVSAWAPRAPFLWAVLPPFVAWGLEKMAFSTSYFWDMLRYRLLGPGGAMAQADHQDFTASLIPHHFLSTPGLWTGFLVAAGFLFMTVRLRRSRGPI